MERDLSAWLATQDFRDTLPTATIMPPQAGDLDRALELFGQMAGRSLLASVQLRPGALIAEGGMGVVREAEQIALGRTVAVKTLRADKRDPGSVRDLLREAWVTGSLEHPNVVPVHHLGVDDNGLPALVLKRVEGVEWSKLMHDAPEVARRFGAHDLLAWNLDILLHVLNAIRFAHSRGIIHRDLKPSNVMIGDFGEVYVLDWGVAVSLRDDREGRLPRVKDVNHIAGTPCYMAPEMLQPDGEHPLSERTDVYLAGAVLFEIIAGQPPHAGKTAVAVMTSVLTSRPELPRTTPSELAAICMRAMDPDPAQRFESADALRVALQSYLGHRGSEHLAARARARLSELRLAISADNRDDIYRVFSACRFGFHEALATWRDNADATRGLEDATLAVARYELSRSDAQAAVALLSELDNPPALLVEARHAAAEQAMRRKQLEQLGQEHDLAIGRRTRAWLGVAIGLFFAILPFIPHSRMLDHERQFISTLVVVSALAIGGYMFRTVLGSTLVNRRLFIGILFIFAANSVLVGAGWMLGLSVIHIHVLMLFLYFVSSAMLALTVDLHLIPTALGFALAFLFAARYPEYWMYAKSAGSFAFAVNVLWAWLLPK